MMPGILLLNDTVDHDNWGANACSEWLKRIISDRLPDVTFTSVLSHWTTDRFYIRPWWLGNTIETRRPKLIGRFSDPLAFLPAVADDFDRIADAWNRGEGGPFAEEFLTKLDTCDAVVFNAEGSTYRNNTSAVRCLFALWLTVTRFNKPAFFTNGSVTLTPVFPILNAMVARTFEAITAVSVRECCSYDNVHHWIPNAGIALYPDSVFYSAERAVQLQDADTIQFIHRLKETRYFCFSLSMLTSSIGGYQRAGIKATALYDLIRSLQTVVPTTVLMARDGMDQSIIRNLADATGSMVFGPEHHYASVGLLLENAQFMMSGRYHHLIMAAIAGCPAIPQRTTSHKVDGLCRLMSPLLGKPVDPTWLRPVIGDVTDRAHEIMDRGDELRRDIRRKSVELGKRAAGIGEMIHRGMGL